MMDLLEPTAVVAAVPMAAPVLVAAVGIVAAMVVVVEEEEEEEEVEELVLMLIMVGQTRQSIRHHPTFPRKVGSCALRLKPLDRAKSCVRYMLAVVALAVVVAVVVVAVVVVAVVPLTIKLSVTCFCSTVWTCVSIVTCVSTVRVMVCGAGRRGRMLRRCGRRTLRRRVCRLHAALAGGRKTYRRTANCSANTRQMSCCNKRRRYWRRVNGSCSRR
jgi:hypothetical protein